MLAVNEELQELNKSNISPLDLVDEELDIEEQQEQTTFDIAELGQAVKVASEGALTVKTVATYNRYTSYKAFRSFD
jgi:hypothetical protein